MIKIEVFISFQRPSFLMYKLVISSFEEHMEYFSSKQGGSEIWVQLYVKIYQQGFTKPYAF